MARDYLDWLPVGAGLLALYAITFYGLATTLWRSDEYAHGPIILAIVIWLTWRKRRYLLAKDAAAHPLPGLIVLMTGLLFYVVGRSYDIGVFEVGSLIPVLMGVLLAMRGGTTLRKFGFP